MIRSHHNPNPITFLAFVLAFFFSRDLAVFGCGYGAPQVPLVCRTMTPNHGVAGQLSPLPYTLTLDKTKVKPGEDVALTIGGGPFKGFLVQGKMALRYGGLRHFPVGTFRQGSANYKVLKCGGLPNSTATHVSPEEKTAVTLTWTAPDAVGNYSLVATVVKDGATFWVAKPSPGIEVVYCVKPQ